MFKSKKGDNLLSRFFFSQNKIIIDLLKKKLVSKGAKVDLCFNTLAAQENCDLELFNFFLKNSESFKPTSVLFGACRNRSMNFEIIKLLLNLKANAGSSALNDSPFYCACSYNTSLTKEILELLIKDIKDVDEKSSYNTRKII